VADEDVEIRRTDFRVRIDLGGRTLEVSEGARVVATYPVAIGSAENPTPTGTFFVKEKIAPVDPDGAYGPLAFGLSGHSPTIRDSGEFADGVIGVHGTDRPDLVGQAVSHGCIRLSNDDVTALGTLPLPLGTPVEISD
jgi:lipoprotein-anchoring transpeptidase ErfK/SrfK